MDNLWKRVIGSKIFASLNGNALSSALNLGTFVLLTRWLPVEDMGNYLLFLSIATLIDLGRFGITRNAIITLSSGKKEEERNGYFASGLVIDLAVTAGIIALFSFPALILQKGTFLKMFFTCYIVLAVANMYWNHIFSLYQAKMMFNAIAILRLFIFGGFLFAILITNTFSDLTFKRVITLFIVSNFSGSLFGMLSFNAFKYLPLSTSTKRSGIWKFGKFAVSTSLFSSMLKSADTYIIGMSAFFGPAGVAIYGIPAKFLEFIELPLRSILAVAFPKLAGLREISKRHAFVDTLRNHFKGALLLAAGTAFIIIIFGKQALSLLGGPQYQESLRLQYNLLIALMAFGVMLVPDRFSGVALEALNKPGINMRKTMLMLILNIAGNVVAVFYLRSLLWVGLTSVIFASAGTLWGIYHLVNLDIPLLKNKHTHRKIPATKTAT